MVVQKTVDRLKQGTHDEKHAAASTFAILVVVILFIGWGYLFLRKLRANPLPTIDTSAIPEGLYDVRAVEQARQVNDQINQQQYDQLRELRDSAAQDQVPSSLNVQTEGFSGAQDFGSDESSF